MTINQKIKQIETIKDNIKKEIALKGVDMDNVVFEDYPQKISMISQEESTFWKRNPLWLDVEITQEEKDVGDIIKILIRVDKDKQNKVCFYTSSNSDVEFDWGDGTSVVKSAGSEVVTVKYYDFDSITDDNSLSENHKQVVITIKTSAFEAFRCYEELISGSTYLYNFPSLDINVHMKEIKEFNLGNMLNVDSTNMYHYICERVRFTQESFVSENFLTFYNYLFRDMTHLASVTLPKSLAPRASCNSTFSNCFNLKHIQGDLGYISDLSYTFHRCTSLKEIEVTLDNRGTNTSASSNNLTYSFYYCTFLEKVILKSRNNLPVPVSGGNSMFYFCTNLKFVDLGNIDFANNTVRTSFFAYCSALESVKNLGVMKGTTFATMFDNCRSLIEMPVVDGSAYASTVNADNMFRMCTSLRKFNFINIKSNFSLMNTQIDRENAILVFNQLVRNAAITRTITLTNTPAAENLTDEDKAIVTAKNWRIII